MDKNIRRSQCQEALGVKEEATAREVSEYLVEKGYTNIDERNMAHPRLNELVNLGEVEVCGKKKDKKSNRMVNVYRKVKGD